LARAKHLKFKPYVPVPRWSTHYSTHGRQTDVGEQDWTSTATEPRGPRRGRPALQPLRLHQRAAHLFSNGRRRSRRLRQEARQPSRIVLLGSPLAPLSR
jgi:hypothetical protein